MVAMLSKAPKLSKLAVRTRDSRHRCRIPEHGDVPHPTLPCLVGALWGNIRELEIDTLCACCWKFFLECARSYGKRISVKGSKGGEATSVHRLQIWAMPPSTSFLPALITSLSATAITTLEFELIVMTKIIPDTIALLADCIPGLETMKLGQFPPAENGQPTSIVSYWTSLRSMYSITRPDAEESVTQAHLAAGFEKFRHLRTLEFNSILGDMVEPCDPDESEPDPDPEGAQRRRVEAWKEQLSQQLDATGLASIAAVCLPLQEIRHRDPHLDGDHRWHGDWYYNWDVVRNSETVGPLGGRLELRLRDGSWCALRAREYF